MVRMLVNRTQSCPALHRAHLDNLLRLLRDRCCYICVYLDINVVSDIDHIKVVHVGSRLSGEARRRREVRGVLVVGSWGL